MPCWISVLNVIQLDAFLGVILVFYVFSTGHLLFPTMSEASKEGGLTITVSAGKSQSRIHWI
jgi:hypothetical protein